MYLSVIHVFADIFICIGIPNIYIYIELPSLELTLAPENAAWQVPMLVSGSV